MEFLQHGGPVSKTKTDKLGDEELIGKINLDLDTVHNTKTYFGVFVLREFLILPLSSTATSFCPRYFTIIGTIRLASFLNTMPMTFPRTTSMSE